MRHKNYYKNLNGWSHSTPNKEYYIPHPYQRLYAYTKPSMKFKYMQVIQFVADHDGCKRKDISRGVWKVEPNNDGFMSQVYSNLLYDNCIDYDMSFGYHITDEGRALLEEAYLNDMAKAVTGK